MASSPLPGAPEAAPEAAANAASVAAAPGREKGQRAASHRLPSADLFRGANEIEIVHHEQVYRLRQTSLGKLILTK